MKWHDFVPGQESYWMLSDLFILAVRVHWARLGLQCILWYCCTCESVIGVVLTEHGWISSAALPLCFCYLMWNCLLPRISAQPLPAPLISEDQLEHKSIYLPVKFPNSSCVRKIALLIREHHRGVFISFISSWVLWMLSQKTLPQRGQLWSQQ